MSYLVIDDETNYDDEVLITGWRGYVAQDKFLGHGIRLGCPR